MVVLTSISFLIFWETSLLFVFHNGWTILLPYSLIYIISLLTLVNAYHILNSNSLNSNSLSNPTISFPVCTLIISDGSQLHVFFHSQALYSVPLMPGQGKAALVSITIFWRGAMYIEGFFKVNYLTTYYKCLMYSDFCLHRPSLLFFSWCCIIFCIYFLLILIFKIIHKKNTIFHNTERFSANLWRRKVINSIHQLWTLQAT